MLCAYISRCCSLWGGVPHGIVWLCLGYCIDLPENVVCLCRGGGLSVFEMGGCFLWGTLCARECVGFSVRALLISM